VFVSPLHFLPILRGLRNCPLSSRALLSPFPHMHRSKARIFLGFSVRCRGLVIRTGRRFCSTNSIVERLSGSLTICRNFLTVKRPFHNMALVVGHPHLSYARTNLPLSRLLSRCEDRSARPGRGSILPKHSRAPGMVRLSFCTVFVYTHASLQEGFDQQAKNPLS
jgi:hypothetical protein